MCFNVTSLNKTFLIERTLLLLLNFYIVDTFPGILDFSSYLERKFTAFFFKEDQLKGNLLSLSFDN